MLKKITAYKWYLNTDNFSTTGKEYTVLFDPSVGVEKIISVFAVESHNHKIVNRVDITMAETVGEQLDAFIDGMFDWDSLLATQEADAPQNDQFWNMAKSIVYKHAKSFRD